MRPGWHSCLLFVNVCVREVKIKKPQEERDRVHLPTIFHYIRTKESQRALWVQVEEWEQTSGFIKEPLLYYFTYLHKSWFRDNHGLPCHASNMPTLFPHQGLCTCCSSALNIITWDSYTVPSFFCLSHKCQLFWLPYFNGKPSLFHFSSCFIFPQLIYCITTCLLHS